MLTQTHDTIERIKIRIEELVGAQRFKVWFRNSTQFTCGEGFVKVGVPNLFIGGWIEDHFSDAIGKAAKDVIGKEVQVSFSTDPLLFRNLRKTQLNSQAAFIEKNVERSIREVRGKTQPITLEPPRKLRGKLEEFVVGGSNRLAHSVAMTLVESAGRDCGNVFFHSACGLGKTHLLQGIANGLAARQPGIRWVYASGEEFTNQFLYALRERTLDAFRHRYRDIDVLLLDDVQFIANKKATQEEFLHTFNTIEAGGKRIVLASDAHPKMIADFSESLVNRLVAGMVVRMERPDVETRKEILRRRCAASNYQIPEPVIQYIAEKIQANIRELEGCLIKLLAYAALVKTPITLELARQALEEHLRQTGRMLSVSDIELSVATYFGVTPADLHTSRKGRTIALARNVAMFLARKHTDLSLPEIARVMGNKNHTTVLLACRRIGNLLQASAEVSWPGAAGIQTRKLSDIIQSQEEQMRR